MTWQLPVPGAHYPTSGSRAFGVLRGTRLHQGVDLFAREGSPIYAVDGGWIDRASSTWEPGFSGYGRFVVLRSDLGPWVLYSHLDQVLVRRGQRVRPGQQLGTVGRTKFTRADKSALFSTSDPHLHLEVSPNRYPQASIAARLDPAPFFRPGVEPRITVAGSASPLVLGAGIVLAGGLALAVARAS